MTKYGPYEFMIRYDSTERKLIFVVNGTKHVWDIAELDAKENQSIAKSAKKSKVAERTLAERKFCEIDQFYYSEMFTCPICYGADRERERILQAVELWRNNLLNGEPYTDEELAAQRDSGYSDNFDYLIALIKAEQK